MTSDPGGTPPASLRAAVEAFLAKWLSVEQAVNGVIGLQFARTRTQYDGPQIGAEIEAMKAALQADATLPARAVLAAIQSLMPDAVEADAGAGWQPEWRDIETAPKDGTKILLFREHQSVVEGSWNHGGAMNSPYWMTPSNLFNPTHWMPMPAPPTGPPKGSKRCADHL